MLTPERKRRLIHGAVFASPLIIVKVTGTMLGGGPAPAEASKLQVATPDVPVPVATIDTEWNDEQRAAAAHILAITDQPLEASPMFTVAAIENDDPDEPVTVGDLEVQVNGVMRSATTGAIAFINGESYNVGDMVEDTQWQVTAIIVETRSVEFTDTILGQKVVLSVPIRD